MKKLLCAVLIICLALPLLGCSGLSNTDQRAYDILLKATDKIIDDYAPKVGSLGSTDMKLAIDPSSIRIESGTVTNQKTNNGSDELYCNITLEIEPGTRSESISLIIHPDGTTIFPADDPDEIELAESQDLNCDAINKALEDYYKDK